MKDTIARVVLWLIVAGVLYALVTAQAGYAPGIDPNPCLEPWVKPC